MSLLEKSFQATFRQSLFCKDQVPRHLPDSNGSREGGDTEKMKGKRGDFAVAALHFPPCLVLFWASPTLPGGQDKKTSQASFAGTKKFV